jgi:hypothetical protein
MAGVLRFNEAREGVSHTLACTTGFFVQRPRRNVNKLKAFEALGLTFRRMWQHFQQLI